MLSDKDKQVIINIAQEAGRLIMQYYHSENNEVQYKKDDSPVTLADKASHQYIVSGIKQLNKQYPIISEEDKNVLTYEQRKDWDSFWLVDPLDGTKEFIKGDQDFTVNIAFVYQNKPYWGVVYAPARQWLYYGGIEDESIVIKGSVTQKLPIKEYLNREDIIAVKSKSHSSSLEDEFFKSCGVTKAVSMGSSLKFCLVAEGRADIYYRSGPTWEWDTAAAHSVVMGAKGIVYNGISQTPLDYNKESLKNEDGFLCRRGRA
ncbi:3'(2'),5'-bisphosphate nucleotidase CysQ [Spirochaeta cellobiosiphila]|uniref:3'(2'),5'-bisphosphate nucleotidase CysQ n=1 Tax=Spirochaeta cellobiosiphila TaxID=504483 RepID=UPI000418DE2B|nr:3'(2'),5'-bisphosphate nucleotidase CysQ [Spirochaeta cellobiosiphila]